MQKVGFISLLSLLLSLATQGFADSIKVKDKAFDDVLVSESDTRIYVKIPSDGSTVSFSKNEVKQSDISITQDTKKREALIQQWKSKNKAKQQEKAALEAAKKAEQDKAERERNAVYQKTTEKLLKEREEQDRKEAESKKQKEEEARLQEAKRREALSRLASPDSSTSAHWYEGGTLNESTWDDWRQATYQNKLASAAGWLRETKWKGHTITSDDSEKLRSQADTVVKGLDLILEKGGPGSFGSEKIGRTPRIMINMSTDLGP